jgi:hypothetical protein
MKEMVGLIVITVSKQFLSILINPNFEMLH